MADKIDKIEEIFKKMEINNKSDTSDLKIIQNLIKEVRKSSEYKKKNKKSDSETDSNEAKPTYGITEPKLLPPNVFKFIEEALANKKLSEDFISSNEIFVNFSSTTLVARTKVNSIIHNYIKTNNLYGRGHNQNIIYPDDKIRKLFSLNDNQTLDFSSISLNIDNLYR